MATATKLTVEQFEEQYGQRDQAFEFWYGEAIPKGMPTWVHGLLQGIIVRLLTEAGFFAGSEVEFRVDPQQVKPRPDVTATRERPTEKYPTKGADVVVEITSEDDKVERLREKCRLYQKWGCSHIYSVDPSDRSVTEWVDGSFILRDDLAGIPVENIWAALDKPPQ
jgi:Uma2 family endonuclease